MPGVITMTISLPRDRTLPGVMRVTRGGLFSDDDELILPEIPCRGKADSARAAREGNPSRDPLKPYGDTPSGEYEETQIEMLGHANSRVGKGWIPMQGRSGDALAALENGRSGLGIHGGRGNRGLMATHGCVRVRDADFDLLAKALKGQKFRVVIRDVDMPPARVAERAA